MKRLLVPLVVIGFGSISPFAAAAQDASAAPVRLTLDDAIVRARSTSGRLTSLAALSHAAAEGTRAANAARKPDVEVTAAYSRNSNVPELILSTPGAPPRTIFPNLPNNWRARVGASLPLYTGGRIENDIHASEETERATTADRAAAERDVVLETHVAYVNVLLARDTARVLAEAVASYDAHQKDAKNRMDLGLIASHEVLAVTVERERSELARTQAENAARVAEANLARLVGLPLDTTLELDASTLGDAVSTVTADDLAKRAVAERPELEALRARVRAMEASAQSARAATKPQAGLQAGYDYANPNPKILPLTGDWNDTWSVGFNLSWKFLDGGKSNAASARAMAQADSLRAQLSDLESRIRLEVVTRRLEFDSALAGKVVAARGVDAARDALRVAQDRYKEGVLVSSELLDAETRLLTAQLEITRNEAQIQVARANLTRAAGR